MGVITVVGSLNYDLVTYTDKVPDGGETFQANSFENHLGGKGLNEALAVSRLLPLQSGINVRMVGNVGSDTFGSELKQALVDAKVDVSHVKTIEGSSGVAVILVEISGENRIMIVPGANGELKPTPQELDHIFDVEDKNHFVILQNEFPYTLETVKWLKTNKKYINIAYNPSPFKPIDVSVWSMIDLLIINEGEALLCAENLLSSSEYESFRQSLFPNDKLETFKSLAARLTSLINQDNIGTVIITCGSVGSIYSNSSLKEPVFFKSVKVDKVIDTTGAGDTFLGGVISQLSIGSSYEEALCFATKASSIVIQKNGAATSIPRYDEVSKVGN